MEKCKSTICTTTKRMKTKERIDQAYKRIKELFLLINEWTRGVKETNSEYVEIKKENKKLLMICIYS